MSFHGADSGYLVHHLSGDEFCVGSDNDLGFLPLLDSFLWEQQHMLMSLSFPQWVVSASLSKIRGL